MKPARQLWLAWCLGALVPWCLASCAVECMAKPTLGQDAKQSVRINGFEVRCTKRF